MTHSFPTRRASDLLDRVSASEAEGHRFESCRVRQSSTTSAVSFTASNLRSIASQPCSLCAETVRRRPVNRPTDRPPRRASDVRQPPADASRFRRSEEHTSELQSLMRISYAVFCLNKKKK